MLNKTVAGSKNKNQAFEEERRLNALTLAVQMVSSGTAGETEEDLFNMTESFYSYLETGYFMETEEITTLSDDCPTE